MRSLHKIHKISEEEEGAVVSTRWMYHLRNCSEDLD